MTLDKSFKKDIIKVIANQLMIDRTEINDDSTLESLNADSLHFVDLTLALGKRYGFSFPRGYNEQQVRKIADYVLTHGTE